MHRANPTPVVDSSASPEADATGMQARLFSYDPMRRRVVFNFNNCSSSRRHRIYRPRQKQRTASYPKGKGPGHSPTSIPTGEWNVRRRRRSLPRSAQSVFTEFPRCIGTPTRVPWEASNPREARRRLERGKAGQVPCVSARVVVRFTAPFCARFTTKLRIRTRIRSDRFEFTCLSRYGGVLERAFLLVSFMCLVIACVCSRPAYAGRVC